MSKGIEAIKELRYIVLKFCEDNNKQDNYCIELCDIIEKELQRLEAIDNAKPSEALKDLKELHELAYGNDKTSWKIDEIVQSSHIKQALIKAQEQENFLDDKLLFKDGSITCGFDYKGKSIVAMPLAEYSRLMEQEQVLEIIKEKDVDMYSLRRCETVEEYNIHFAIDEYQKLIEEEFNLLKRMV